ncbi:MAG: recombinase family protein [Defluviitaleaceae bacterium]|nr:recombinase family protein [Defluviitaleaceae bacterium]
MTIDQRAVQKITQATALTKMATGRKTALYMRLSSDDGGVNESDSIVHQRQILTNYAHDQGFHNIMEFVDDGYSGADFTDRPQFQRMLHMVEHGEIGIIVVKDLSRLGREYIQMGMFTEIIFPKNNVRFIAIGDGVDSNKGENDIAVFRNLFNDFHVRDTSRKVRAVKDMQAKQGKRVNGALTPYGYDYCRDTEKLIINEKQAQIIKRMFDLCASGLGPAKIGRIFTTEGIPTPYEEKGTTTGGTAKYHNRWSEATIARMLERKEYIGHTENKKSYSLSYKNKKRIFNDEADRLLFPNTHDPIVDERTFEIVQNIRKNRRRPTKMGEQPMFSGLVYCYDCGNGEYLFRGTTIDPSQFTYNCGTYRGKQRHKCTPHGIRVVVLEQLVMEHINMVTSYVAQNEKAFAESLMKKSQTVIKSEVASKKRDYDKAKRRVVELDKLITQLFEERTLGSLSQERFAKMTANYEQEQSQLENTIIAHEKEQSETAETFSGIDKFLKIARKYLNLQELSGTILRELVEKIVVHEKVKGNGKTTQQVDIHYNFVGIVEVE